MATTAQQTGHDKVLEQLRADGVRYMFGNPGSSEEGLLDALSRFPDIQYILGLQEAAIACLADGYAQATQRPAIVQLHAGVGLGSALGSLYHAYRRHTPMVVIAGEAGVAYDALEAHMAVDLVAMARPVTKYAARAIHPGSVLRLLRRCIKIAATPPCGPVFLALPQDVLDAPNEEPVVPTLIPETRVAPEPALIARAAEMLAGAKNPVILMGDGVSQSGAHAELARLAGVLGAGVWGAMASELIMPWTHPLYGGLTGHMFGHASAGIVRDADAVVICGTYVFPDVFPLLASPFREGAKVIHIDLDSHAIAKNHPITLGLVSDPKLTLRHLADALTDGMAPEQKSAAAARAERIASEKEHRIAQEKQGDESRYEQLRLAAQKPARTPSSLYRFAQELANALPKDAIIFDESLTHFPDLLRWLPPSVPGSFFQTPGGTLGVGIPGAVGVKLAHPDRTVIGFTGDGGAMYTYQALWTAAHYRIGAKFVVCNNGSYRLLKMNLVDYWRQQGLRPDQFPADFPPAFDILDPNLDFVGLARSLGVPGVRLGYDEEITPAVRAMLDHDGPYLIDLDLSRERGVPRPTVQEEKPVTGECPCS
jgi:benzoylformate decarboxylase